MNNSSVAKKIIFGIFFMEFIIAGISFALIRPLIPIIVVELNIDLSSMGASLSFSSLGLLLASLFTISIINKYSHRVALTVGTVMLAIGCLGLYISGNFYLFLASLFIESIGLQSIAICMIFFISETYAKNRGNILLSLNIGWPSGILVASLIVSLILWIDFSWRNIYLLIFITQLFFIFFVIKFLPPLKNRKVNKPLNLVSNIKKVKEIFINKEIILISLIVFLNAAVINTFSTWSTTFFLDLNIGIKNSSLFLAVFSASQIIGMFFKKWSLKRYNERQILLQSSVISLISVCLINYISKIPIKVFFIGIFGISIIGFITLALSMTINLNEKHSGMMIGLLHSAYFIGIIIFQYIVGFLSQNFSGRSVIYVDMLLLLILVVITLFYNFKYQRIKKAI